MTTPDVASAVKAVFEAFSTVEELVAKTLFETVESAQSDVKAIVEGVRAINATKAAQREVLNRVMKDQAANVHRGFDDTELTFPKGGLGGAEGYRKVQLPVCDTRSRTGFRLAPYDATSRGTVSKAELDALVEKIKDQLDSLSELGEMESLRLQMAMDRLSKLMSTLSNMLKKMSDTSQAIISNLK